MMVLDSDAGLSTLGYRADFGTQNTFSIAWLACIFRHPWFVFPSALIAETEQICGPTPETVR
jgi:hypothetical protein